MFTVVSFFIRVCTYYNNKLQVFIRLNHLNITISYSAVLKLVSAISELNEVPIKKWIASKETLGDNVDVSMGVRDIRSNHLKHLCHMFSLLVIKSRIPSLPGTCIMPNTSSHLIYNSFLPKDIFN